MTTFYEQVTKKQKLIDETDNIESRDAIDKWIVRLFLLLIGLMPLLVMGHVDEIVSPLVTQNNLLSSGEKGELFTYFKFVVLIFITSLIAILFILKLFIFEGQIRKNNLNIVLGVFILSIIISTLASPSISTALKGLYNRSDGAISWTCYLILLFVAININYPKKIVTYIAYTLLPFIYINLLIITMNFWGKDLLGYSFINRFIMSTLPDGATFGKDAQLLGTLNQWNYMSGMFAMMTIMYLVWAITSKKAYGVIIGAVTASVSILVMFMSISTSGFLTVLVCLPILIVIAVRTSKWKSVGLAFVVFLIIVIPLFNVLAEKNPRVWDESFGFIIKSNPYKVENVSSLLSNEKVYADGNNFELPELPNPGYGSGSGRVYIWEKTFDLIKDRPILGYGMDTIIYNFPHYNIEARAALWTEDTIVDKPHNLYLGIFYGTGILGFLAILALVLLNLNVLIKSIITKNWTISNLSLVGFAYCVQAMFNDSLPSVTAIAFLLIGISFGLLKQEKQDLNN